MAQAINNLVEFFRAGETLSARDAIYIDPTDGKVYKLDPVDENKAVYAGITRDAGGEDDWVRVVQAGKLKGFTGLTPGQFVYASTTTPGAFQLTEPPASNRIILGTAKNATDIIVNAALSAAKSGGAGGGSGFEELMANPSFETEEDEGVATNATVAFITSPTETPFDKRALQITFSGAGSYCVTKNTGADFLGLPSNVSCQVQTDDAGISFGHYSNGNLIASEDVLSDGSVRKYKPMVQSLIDTTSEGWCVNAAGASVAVVNNCSINTKDNVYSVGIQSDWEDCGLTTSDFTGFGTVTSIEDSCRRDGPDLLMQVKFTVGTPTATEARVNLKLNGNALTSSSNISSLIVAGKGNQNGSGITNFSGYVPNVEASNTFHTFGAETSTLSGLGKYNGNQLAESGVVISYFARIPIANWSAGQDALSSAGGGSNVRLDTANGYGSTATKIRRFTNQRVNIGSNIEYVDSAANGASFTVKNSGFYFISYSDNFNASTYFGVTKNAPDLTANIDGVSNDYVLTQARTEGADSFITTSWAGWLSSGDIIRPHTKGQATTTAGYTYFSIVGILDQFNATLRDVVKSQGTSNGKPVLLSAFVASNGAVTGDEGSWLDDCVVSDTSLYTCQFDSPFVSTPKCWTQNTGGTTDYDPQRTVTTNTSASQLQFRAYNVSGVKAARSTTVFCKGEKP